jgi:hypothetical protein
MKYLGDLWRYTMDDGCSPCMSIGSTHHFDDTRDKITIYPNPFNEETTIKFNLNIDNATLLIFNSLGQPIKQIDNISGDQFTLKREDLLSGLYLLQILDRKGTFTAKIFIMD